jgi:probable rRNA maturation factor
VPDIEVEVEDPAWNAVPEVEALVRRAALAARPDGGVVVLLADDDAVAELNQQFRHKAGPTNVLSFPAPENPENLLGDIALAYGVCAREAVEQGKTLADHLSHLTVHGVLHLAGYDHQTDDEAEAMEELERRLLAALGVSDPYATEQS